MTTCVSSLRSVILLNGSKEIFNVVPKSVSNAAPNTGAETRDKDGLRTLLTDSAHLKREKELELARVEREGNAQKDLASIALALAGDLSGYKELVERYEKRVFSIALAVLGNSEDAKDVAQEAFIKVYQKLESFRGESSFYTWLYRITFNLAVDLSRKRYRTRELGFADNEPSKYSDSGVRLDAVSVV